MRDFIQPFSDNLGGIITFKFIPSEDIDTIEMALNGVIEQEITLKSGKQWYCGYGTLGTIGYTEPGEESPAGTVYKRAFTAFYPKDNSEMNFLFQEMRNRLFVIDYRDSNGLRKVVGGIEEPLKFLSALNTQTDVPGRSGHNISFYGDGTYKAYTYNI
jgi:hypothetical protein